MSSVNEMVGEALMNTKVNKNSISPIEPHYSVLFTRCDKQIQFMELAHFKIFGKISV